VPMAWLSEDERRRRAPDGAHDRAVLVNQSLLAGVVLIAALVTLSLSQVVDPVHFVVGVTMVFVTAVAAVLVPWKRLPPWAAGVLPIVDVVAIGFIRDSAPQAGTGLLWAFPAMWIGALFGVVGAIGTVVAVAGMVGVMTASDPTQNLSTSTFLLPLIIGALAVLSHLVTRRANAQRLLLEEQSRTLQRSVERARRQEDLVTEVLDAVDFGVIRITADGDLVVTNEAHARLLGSADLGGDDLPAFAPDGQTPLSREHVPLARAREGDTFENELVWYSAPGENRRALSVTARALQDIDGTPAGSVIVSRDVTAEEQALRAREDLVASVSHELRTPLTSIVGYLELALDRPDLPDAVRRDLEVAERNAGRLLELVADILAMSTVSRHGVELALHPESVDVAQILEAAVEAVRPGASERRISVDTSDARAAVAEVDPHRIRQVLDNLLTNAVKYNDDGGWVRAAVTTDRVHVWVTVSDDGPGISTAEQQLVFDRFYRSDAVRNSTTHGSGLGLSISRDIARAHGGDVFVASRPGEGATFTLRVPVVREDA
jgi:two-component system, OmpR family, phosphate regulon sensor histidine kinase PhoR